MLELAAVSLVRIWCMGLPGSGDQREPVLGGEGPQTTGPYIDLRGATIFGYDEFARRVAEAQAQNARRAGLAPA